LGGLTIMPRQVPLLALFLCLSAGSAFSQSSKQSDIVRLCKRVAEIKELPMKGYPGVDAAYDAIVGAGETVVPCLVEKITDTTPMRDPRCPPFSNRTTVGDVAYFVLTDITKLDFIELLPADIQRKYKTEGAYVYHDYIDRKGARGQLRSRVRQWWRQQHRPAQRPPNNSLDRSADSLFLKLID
jgi:hypothetical protein